MSPSTKYALELCLRTEVEEPPLQRNHQFSLVHVLAKTETKIIVHVVERADDLSREISSNSLTRAILSRR